MKFLCILAILAVLLCIWFFIEQHILVIRRVKISAVHLDSSFCGIKLLQISDIHHREMGKHHRRISDAAKKLQPDLICVTGDLISRDMQDFTAISALLCSLTKLCPVYVCLGNHELDLPAATLQKFCETVTSCGATLLRNRTVSFQNVAGATIFFSGADLDSRVYRDENRGFSHLKKYTADDLHEALGTPKSPTILLAHNPFFLDSYADWGADLVLSGHVHGGLVRLPIIGGILSPERRFFPSYSKGIYRKNGTIMYVSGGIGKPRLFNPPEINLLQLNSVQK